MNLAELSLKHVAVSMRLQNDWDIVQLLEKIIKKYYL